MRTEYWLPKLARNAERDALAHCGELHTDYLRFGDEQKMVMTCRTFAQKRGGLWSGPRPFKTYLIEDTQ
jgi:G:T-mismatch repair DNA endonuclease (very short patch repair protein)